VTARRTQRGLVLIVVLWGIAALSLIAAAMISSAITAARISHNDWKAVQVQTAADTGTQRAILSLFDPNPLPGRRFDGRQQDLRIGDAAVSTTIQDELGRIDINYATQKILRDYFVASGMDGNQADTLSGRVVEWRSPRSTRGLSDIHAGSSRARGAPFASVDELNLVDGMTPQWYARIASGLTVFSHSMSFDTRLARPEVLASIPGMDSAKVAAQTADRMATYASAGHAFAIVATAREGEVQFTRRCVVLLTGDPGRPYLILDWR
jgi:general secretion pathway protein K